MHGTPANPNVIANRNKVIRLRDFGGHFLLRWRVKIRFLNPNVVIKSEISFY